MTIELSPGLVLIVGALIVPALKGYWRAGYMLALPVLAFALTLTLDSGQWGIVHLFDLQLTTLRVDRLSLIFGYIFMLAALIGVIYQLHVRDTLQHIAALIYAGSAIGAVFAGDLVTLFLYWEGTAIGSVFLIWASRSERALAAGMRYLVIQVGSGVLLLAGAMIHYRETGSIAFNTLDIETLGGLLIFLSFGIKCAFPLLHNWLQDAYPEATVTGTVMLSAFTTKLAVYALARGFAGTEILVPIGAVMTAFPIFYAVIENDLRRVLAYSLNNSLASWSWGLVLAPSLPSTARWRTHSATSSIKRCFLCRWARFSIAPARSRARSLAGCTRACRGPPGSALSGLLPSPPFRCFPVLSPNR